MASNIAIDPDSGRPCVLEGANDATLVEDPDGRGAYLVRGSVDVDVDHNDVYRSVDQGASWELVASGLPLNATITDPECLSYGTTLYRVTAVSALPSSSVSRRRDSRLGPYAWWVQCPRTIHRRVYTRPAASVSPSLVATYRIVRSRRSDAVSPCLVCVREFTAACGAGAG